MSTISILVQKSSLRQFSLTLLLCSVTSTVLPQGTQFSRDVLLKDEDYTRAISHGDKYIDKLTQVKQLTQGEEPNKLWFHPRTCAILSGRILIAEGDSWFDYPAKPDIVTELEKLEWKVYSSAHYGDTLESMIYDTKQLYSLAETFIEARLYDAEMSMEARTKRLERNDIRCTDKNIYDNLLPKAILLSGGGNDIIGAHLSFLLEHARSSVVPGEDRQRPDGIYFGLNRVLHIQLLKRLQRVLIEYISAISSICRRSYGEEKCQSIPIYIHGYDYAKASGVGYRLIFEWAGPWLRPAFDLKDRKDIEIKKVIEELIDSYNHLLCDVAQRIASDESISNPVYHLDFRNTVGQDEWSDEIHPAKAAVTRLASSVSEQIKRFHKRFNEGSRASRQCIDVSRQRSN